MQNEFKIIKEKDVLRIIQKLADSIRFNRYINERYLHHSFSYLLQKEFTKLDLTNQLINKQSEIKLHPEWATYRVTDRKHEVDLPQYRKYKNYKPVKKLNSKKGKGASFDFTIGKYDKPFIGIEFKWKYKWEKKPIVFDFLKCLDTAFEYMTTSISYNVILREERDIDFLKKEKQTEKFKDKLKDAYTTACNILKKLNALVDDSRRVFLIVTVISKDNKRLHWYCDREKNEFKLGFPDY